MRFKRALILAGLAKRCEGKDCIAAGGVHIWIRKVRLFARLQHRPTPRIKFPPLQHSYDFICSHFLAFFNTRVLIAIHNKVKHAVLQAFSNREEK